MFKDFVSDNIQKNKYPKKQRISGTLIKSLKFISFFINGKVRRVRKLTALNEKNWIDILSSTPYLGVYIEAVKSNKNNNPKYLLINLFTLE